MNTRLRHQLLTYVRKVILSSFVSLFFCLSQVGIVHTLIIVAKQRIMQTTPPDSTQINCAEMHQLAIFRQKRSNGF